jgi:hypothetical protein
MPHRRLFAGGATGMGMGQGRVALPFCLPSGHLTHVLPKGVSYGSHAYTSYRHYRLSWLGQDHTDP